MQVTTAKTDADLTKWIPRATLALPLDRVTPGMLTDSMIALVDEGRAVKSIHRYRAMLGAFFSFRGRCSDGSSRPHLQRA